MFERYSEPARRVIFYSRSMAHQLGSPEIETEHLLLGLLRADMALSRRFLGSPWAAEEIWQEIERTKSIRAMAPSAGDLPLSTTAKGVLHRAAEEADQLSSQKIGTEHFLLGLLGDDKCLAGVLLAGHGLGLVSIREELSQNPHDDAATEKFVREPSSLPRDVVKVQTRIRSILSRTHEAIANRDFAKAGSCLDEERKERDELYLLCRQHGLSVWLYE